MKRALLGLAVVVAACTVAEPPVLVQRNAPPVGSPNHDAPPDLTHAEDSDAGPPNLDAGVCCMVRFALPQLSGEEQGEMKIVNTARYLPLELDGGVWSVTACMKLRPARYYFELGTFVADETGETDGGFFITPRTNPVVPTELSGAAPLVNVFDPGTASTCGELDAGLYEQLPDAGTN